MGIAPTGRRIGWGSVRLAWIKDARVIGQWAQPDLWNIYRQLTVRAEPGRDLAVVPTRRQLLPT